MAPAELAAPDEESSVAPRRFTVEEYHRGAEFGLYQPEERLELVYGQIVRTTSPKGTEHVYVVSVTDRALAEVIGGSGHVRRQEPLAIGEHDEPEPDLAVVKGQPVDYLQGHPVPDDVCLVVEVADSTLRFDRKVKSRAYGGAGISEYWIVNLRERLLEVYTEPSGDGYGLVTLLGEDEAVTPGFALSSRIEVSSILPPT
jgi:Uma2 family endonuclease